MKYCVFVIIVCVSIVQIDSLLTPNGESDLNNSIILRTQESYPKFSLLSLGFTDDININSKIFIGYFVTLPAEIKKIILCYLSVSELFEFIQNEEFAAYHELAAEAYGQIYGEWTVMVKDHRYITGKGFTVSNGEVHFGNTTKFITFLLSFNRHIKSLKIEFSSFAELHDVIAAISICAKTLTKFDIRYTHDNDFDFIKNISFPNVEELVLWANNFRDYVLDLNETFPNVRRLATTINRFTDRTWIERNFSNLTHLQIDMGRDYFNEEEIVRILEKNSKITNLGIVKATPSILRIINEHFPNIVNLGVVLLDESFAENRKTISMEHVERFFFDDPIDMELQHFISFEKLKEIQWHSRAEPERLLIDFVKKHQHQIEALGIVNTVILDEHLAQMGSLKMLRRASFRFDKDENETITENGVFEFFISNQNLSEIHLFDAKQELRRNLDMNFKSSGIKGWMQTFDPDSTEAGHVHIIKKPWQPTNWSDDMKFLRENFL